MIRNGHGMTPYVYAGGRNVPGVSGANDDAFETAARALRAAENICVLTGAGISSESGIPTFRDALTGRWSQYDPEDLATPEAFQRQPDVVWSWYAMRAAQVRRSQPNAGHAALVTLAAYVPHFTLVTQNVDDLHARAGNTDIIALHGKLQMARCSAGCGFRMEMSATASDRAPLCAQCNAKMRPDVVWFGEALSERRLNRARAATFACDVFLSVGTSNVVEPAASLPWLAAAHGATVLVVNPSLHGQRRGPSILPLQGYATTMLSRLIAAAFTGQKPRRSDD